MPPCTEPARLVKKMRGGGWRAVAFWVEKGCGSHFPKADRTGWGIGGVDGDHRAGWRVGGSDGDARREPA